VARLPLADYYFTTNMSDSTFICYLLLHRCYITFYITSHAEKRTHYVTAAAFYELNKTQVKNQNEVHSKKSTSG